MENIEISANSRGGGEKTVIEFSSEQVRRKDQSGISVQYKFVMQIRTNFHRVR